jgi:hypothetical protein
MSNYLKTIEFEDSEIMGTVLLAAKLALDPDVWRKIKTDVFVDDDEAVVWTEADSYKPVIVLWDYIYNTFDWDDIGVDMPEESEIELSEYFEDNAVTHNTTSRMDALLEAPSFEFEHNLYAGNIDSFVGGVREQVA